MNIIGRRVKIVSRFSCFRNYIGVVIAKSREKYCYNILFYSNFLTGVVGEGEFTILDGIDYLVNFRNPDSRCNWCDNILKIKKINLNREFHIWYCPKCLR